jgi:hypothetical protein
MSADRPWAPVLTSQWYGMQTRVNWWTHSIMYPPASVQSHSSPPRSVHICTPAAHRVFLVFLYAWFASHYAHSTSPLHLIPTHQWRTSRNPCIIFSLFVWTVFFGGLLFVVTAGLEWLICCPCRDFLQTTNKYQNRFRAVQLAKVYQFHCYWHTIWLTRVKMSHAATWNFWASKIIFQASAWLPQCQERQQT